MDTNNLINQAVQSAISPQPINVDQTSEKQLYQVDGQLLTLTELLYQRMTGFYPLLWAKAYGTDPSREWIIALRDLSFDQISAGFNRMVLEKLQYPPNPIQFRTLCFPKPEELGLPSENQAFNESLKSNCDKHPWVKEMLRTMSSEDAYEFRRADAKTARTLFKTHWNLIIDRVMAGEEAPDIELEIEDKPVKASKETAAEGMAALRGLFGD